MLTFFFWEYLIWEIVNGDQWLMEVTFKIHKKMQSHNLNLTILLQEMKLVEYMYRSQLPTLRDIIALFESSVKFRKDLIGKDHQVIFFNLYNTPCSRPVFMKKSLIDYCFNENVNVHVCNPMQFQIVIVWLSINYHEW